MLFYNFFILITLPLVWSNDEPPFVETPLGWIKGYYDVSSFGKKFEAFEGIPYAQPPIGDLRFEPPRKVLSWAGNWSATIASTNCMELNMFHASAEQVSGVEDCLYLNLYRPVRPQKLLPIIVWIHPGALHFNPYKRYGPKFLMNREVIFVQMNFRLGPLGFLSTADEIVPGNMGLKDQSMALKWISENIKYFGGDPDKVTLTGGSSGGSCAHYHMLSPMSAGLFQRAMSFSGVATNWVIQTGDPLKNAKILAKYVGCSTDSKRQMIACLKTRSAKSLFQALSAFTFWNGTLLYSPFSIVVENVSNGSFLDASPIDIMKSGDINDVPWLVTTTTAGEGMFPAGVFFLNDTRMQSLNDNWEDLALPLLKMEDLVPNKYHHKVAESIRKYYFGSKSISTDTKELIENLCGDVLIRIQIERSIRLMSKVMRSPIWFYSYSYRAAGTHCNLITNTNWTGLCHVDDTLLVVHTPEVMDEVTRPSDLAMQKDLLDLWVSMADDGIPKILHKSWRPISPSDTFLGSLKITHPGQYDTSFSINFSNNDFWSSLPMKQSLL